MTPIPLRPLNPLLHADYAPAVDPGGSDHDPLPTDVRTAVAALLRRRSEAPEEELDAIDRAIVAQTSWYVLRPDAIARRTLAYHGWSVRHSLPIDQATIILAALGEAGYPLAGDGAPDYPAAGPLDWHPPVRGPERDRVLWAAARYWATAASQHLTYVSLGDCRGYLPRPVQYDQPGGLHPQQRAALTLGPTTDDLDSRADMRRHTRLLLRVRPADVA